MKPVILAMLLGMICTNLWWLFAKYKDHGPGFLLLCPALVTTGLIILWIAIESKGLFL
jgi:hypothetical protein